MQPLDNPCQRLRILVREQQAVAVRHLTQAVDVAGHEGLACRHPLDVRQRQSLPVRRHHHHVRRLQYLRHVRPQSQQLHLITQL